MSRNEDHQHLSEVLKQFVEKNKLQKGLDKVDVQEAWNNQMGPVIQKYTTDLQFKNSTLFVRLSSSVLREELAYGKQKILDNLNEDLGREIIEKLVLR